MPHDAHGNLLIVGDQVVIPGTVTFIAADSGFCNVTVESEFVMPGNGTKSSFSAINAAQVEKAFTTGTAVSDEERGIAAYAGYCKACGGRSLISGAVLPTFAEQSPEIQAAWIAAANAVRDLIFQITPVE